MSGSAAVSAAKNRRTREKEVVQQPSRSQMQQQQQYQPQQQQIELTPLQALHQHDYRLRKTEEVLKLLLATTEELKNSNSNETDNSMQETIDLFNERISSIEKYIDEELSKSLTLKEKEDKEGEDVIYEKISGLEKLLKEMKTELVRIQSSARETSVSFIKYKGDTDAQLKEVKETLKTLTNSVNELSTKITETLPTPTPTSTSTTGDTLTEEDTSISGNVNESE